MCTSTRALGPHARRRTHGTRSARHGTRAACARSRTYIRTPHACAHTDTAYTAQGKQHAKKGPRRAPGSDGAPICRHALNCQCSPLEQNMRERAHATRVGGGSGGGVTVEHAEGWGVADQQLHTQAVRTQRDAQHPRAQAGGGSLLGQKPHRISPCGVHGAGPWCCSMEAEAGRMRPPGGPFQTPRMSAAPRPACWQRSNAPRH